jgi:hypothetical protein
LQMQKVTIPVAIMVKKETETEMDLVLQMREQMQKEIILATIVKKEIRLEEDVELARTAKRIARRTNHPAREKITEY